MIEPTPLIEVKRLRKAYGTATAVRDLSLTVSGGQTFCFLGPNGAGKTTTIHMIMGLKNPTGGEVRINGVSVSDVRIHEVRRRIGYLPEQPVLYDFLTGREFLRFLAELYSVPESRLQESDALLERLDMTDAADALIRTYSMGMKKKIALLGALVHDPDILILDEPTGSLDAGSARVVKDLIREARDAGKLVFMTTHVMEIAERIADRIAIINRGTLVEDGTLEELRSRHGGGLHDSLEDVFLSLVAAQEPQADHISAST